MKHKYCFLRNHGLFKPDDFIYAVWVGSSVREQTIFTLVDEYCKDCGLYFKLWSSHVDSALSKAKAQFRMDDNVIAHPFRTASVTISQLYKMIIDDSFEKFEASQQPNRFQLLLMFRNNPRYIQAHQKYDVILHACPEESKNLSGGKMSDRQKAVACTVALFGLIVLDVIVTQMMNW